MRCLYIMKQHRMVLNKDIVHKMKFKSVLFSSLLHKRTGESSRLVWKVVLSIQMQQILIKVKLCSYPIFLLNNNRWVLLTLAHTISIHYALHSVCCIVWLWWRKSHPFILLRFKLFAFVHFLYQFFSSLFCPFHWGRVDSVALVSTLPSPYSPRSGQII